MYEVDDISQRYIILEVVKNNFLVSMKNDVVRKRIEFESDCEGLRCSGDENQLNLFSCIGRLALLYSTNVKLNISIKYCVSSTIVDYFKKRNIKIMDSYALMSRLTIQL